MLGAGTVTRGKSRTHWRLCAGPRIHRAAVWRSGSPVTATSASAWACGQHQESSSTSSITRPEPERWEPQVSKSSLSGILWKRPLLAEWGEAGLVWILALHLLTWSPWANLSEPQFLHPQKEANPTKLTRSQDTVR